MPGNPSAESIGVKGTQDLKVWLIDDDENDHVLVQRAVDRSAMRVSFCSFPTAVDAMRELSSQCVPPDIILCDLKMPALSGDTFVRWLRSTRHRAVPVVMRSTSDIEKDIVAAYDSGANAFVNKGMELKAITKNVRHMVQFGMMLKRSRREHAAPKSD